MNTTKKILAAAMLSVSALTMTACQNSEYVEREKAQTSQDKTAERPEDTLEQRNLRKKIAIEEKSDQIGYVYLFDRSGNALGYYVVKGKVSSSGSQIAPEQEIICKYSGDSCQAVDSSQDDGTYGTGDDGIFFFTSDGAFVHTNTDYLYSTTPLAVEAPELESTK